MKKSFDWNCLRDWVFSFHSNSQKILQKAPALPFREANRAIGERGLSWKFNWNALKNVFPPSDMNRRISDWPIHARRYFHPISLCHPPKLRHASAIHSPPARTPRRAGADERGAAGLSSRSPVNQVHADSLPNKIIKFQYVPIHVHVFRCSLGSALG